MKKVFGITEAAAKEILEIALSTGGEFAEVFMEKTTNEVIATVLGQVQNLNVSKVKGAALHVIKDGMEVNASVTDCSVENLKATAQKLASSFEGEKTTEVLEFVEKEVPTNVVSLKPRYDSYEPEIKMLQEATAAARNYSPEIVQVNAQTTKKIQEMFVFASDSTWQTDKRDNTRLFVTAIASDGKTMQN